MFEALNDYLSIKTFFVGVWPIIAGYGLWGLVILGALAWAWFMPVFKKTALWVALSAGIILVSFSFGVHDGEQRVQKRWDAYEAAVVDRAGKNRSKAEKQIGPAVSNSSSSKRVQGKTRPLDKFDRK